jgi:hypothetical protein
MPLRPQVLALAASTLLLAAADRPRPPPMEVQPPPASQLAPAPEEARPVRSCRVSAVKCIDWEGDYPGVDLKGRCKALRGTWSDGACPTEKQVGTCTVREFSSRDRSVTHAYPPQGADDARADCLKEPRASFMKR